MVYLSIAFLADFWGCSRTDLFPSYVTGGSRRCLRIDPPISEKGSTMQPYAPMYAQPPRRVKEPAKAHHMLCDPYSHPGRKAQESDPHHTRPARPAIHPPPHRCATPRCYAPTPAKNVSVLPTDDYMAPWAEALWGKSGRDDLSAIRQMPGRPGRPTGTEESGLTGGT